MARPRKINRDVLRKLEEGFMLGLSDRQACLYADIALSTLYEYQKVCPAFSERKEALKENVKMRAKINIAKVIDEGDIDMSIWYLKHAAADEFSTKQQIAIENPYGGLTQEQLERLADADTG